MTLPEIRERLKLIAVELSQLSDQIKRRTPGPKAPRTSARMTPALRTKIRAFVRANPGKSQLEVGKVFNVNPGRVSEVMRGKRK